MRLAVSSSLSWPKVFGGLARTGFWNCSAWVASRSARGKSRPSNHRWALTRFFFDTMVFEPDQLQFLVAKSGADHVMLGTDYPYDMGDDDPLEFIGSVPGLNQDQIDLISGGNAARLMGLSE